MYMYIFIYTCNFDLAWDFTCQLLLPNLTWMSLFGVFVLELGDEGLACHISFG